NHPLGRTLYVIEVENLNEALEYVDESVQTVGVSSEKRKEELKEKFTLLGVDRVTDIGKMGSPHLSAPQDGAYTISRMGRWVSVR
ncbi:hypothetical protein AKJ52_02860, partial [candidate division MSBL1 archaeon SCGC-AAA382C18]